MDWAFHPLERFSWSDHARSRPVVASFGLGVAVGLAALGGILLTRESGRIASIWVANALVIAALLKTPRASWPYWVVAGLAGNLAADRLTGDTSGTALALSLCNTVEIVLAGWSIRSWLGEEAFDLTRFAPLVKFIAAGGIAAPAVAALLAAVTLHAQQGTPIADAFRTWFSSDALGIVVVVPLLTSTSKRELLEMGRRPQRLEVMLFLPAIALLTGALFWWHALTWLFLLCPLVVGTALRLGLGGAAVGNLLATAGGIAAIAIGSIHADAQTRQHVELLQLVVFTCVLTSLPVVALLRSARSSETRFRDFFEHHHVPMWFVRTGDGSILDANPAAVRFYGHARDALLGMKLWEINQISRDAFLRDASDGSPSDRRQEGIVPQRLGSGEIRQVEMSTTFTRLDGEPVLLSSMVDVTERHLAEAALKESEEKFRTTFMTNPDACYLATLSEGVVLEVNSGWEKLFGYAREEAIGKTSRALNLWVNSADRVRMVAELRSKGSVSNIEVQGRRKSGEIFWGLISTTMLPIDGQPCTMGVVRDVTERNRAMEERQKLQDQLLQAQRVESIGRLAGGVAHDFNNLLTVINGYGDMVMSELDKDDPLLRPMAELCKAGQRAADLTRQLLAFSRQQVVRPQVVDVNDLLAQNRAMFQRLIGEDIELVTHFDPAAGRTIADPGQLHQVVMNLVVNARDAMTHGGRLTLETASIELGENDPALREDMSPGAFVRLTIADTGIGMSADVVDKIFEPFFTTKQEGEGTGLGLSTAYGLVRQCGGSIAVRSEPGRGSRFEIHLPRVDGPVVPALEATPVPGTPAWQTVLVVEDQTEVRHLVVTVLRARGYHVVEAAMAGEALLIAERHPGPIHLMLTDVVMPHMTGKDLADRLRPLRPEMKVLYMSGYTADVIAKRGQLESGVLYIAKPFTPGVLAARVREILEST